MARHHHTGGAVVTTCNSVLASGAVTITIADATGWPDTSIGPFAIVVSKGTAREEKMLVTVRAGTALTVTSGNRGYDDTVAKAHNSGDDIRVTLPAAEIDSYDAHVNDPTLDHHTNYLTTGRHDVEGRHTFGAALGTAATPASIGTANGTGSGANPAREDHVHELGSGSIDDAALFGTGVVATAALADNSVTPAKTSFDEVRLRRAATQSISAGSTTTISWDTEDADAGGFITVTGDTVTVPSGKGGIYIISVDLDPTGSTDLEAGIQFLSESGGPTLWGGRPTIGGAPASCTMVRRLADAATVRGWAYNPGAGASNITAAFMMVRISD